MAQIGFGATQGTNSAAFDPVSSVVVLKDIGANSQGTNAGTATITSVKNQFSTTTGGLSGFGGETPEPGTVALLGGGLMAILIGRRRRRRGNSTGPASTTRS